MPHRAEYSRILDDIRGMAPRRQRSRDVPIQVNCHVIYYLASTLLVQISMYVLLKRTAHQPDSISY
jgi:hypothetical protein